jgi:hypothetical protein
LGASQSGEEAEFFAELHRLRPPSGPKFVENTAGVGLHRILAHKKLFGDLPVAETLGYQRKNLQFTASDVKVFSFLLVGDEPVSADDRHFLYNNCLPFACYFETKPDAEDGKGCRDQPAVDFDRVFDYEKPVLRPFEDGNQDPADQPVQQHVALHRYQGSSHWNYRTDDGADPLRAHVKLFARVEGNPKVETRCPLLGRKPRSRKTPVDVPWAAVSTRGVPAQSALVFRSSG